MDIIAGRIHEIWNPVYNVRLERDMWIGILQDQLELEAFPDIGAGQRHLMLHCYRAAAPHVDLDAIEQRERITRHDLKARLEEFNHLAGFQQLHIGLTSADIVDNATQIRMRRCLERFYDLDPARFYQLGRILTDWPLRGLKGAVGTQQDLLDIFSSDYEKVQSLENRFAARYGFSRVCSNTGQMYPRSLDHEIVSALFGAMIDLGHPLHHVLNGYASMVAGYAGQTWNEGDVSTSVIRRVAIPGAFRTVADILEDVAHA